jgi:hypothetical protein
MHDEDHGHRRGIGRPRRARQIADQLQTVTGAHHHRLHRDERRARQRGTQCKEVANGLGASVVVEEPTGCGVALDVRDPVAVVRGGVGTEEIALRGARQPRVVVGISGIDDLPAAAGEGRHRSDGPATHRLVRDLREIRLRILPQHPKRSGRHVLSDDGGLIAAACVEPVERATIVAEPERPRGERIRHVELREGRPLAAGVALEVFNAAVL